MKNLQNFGLVDLDEAVAILSSAFQDDPVMNWMSDYPGFIEDMFHAMLPLFLEHGICYKVADGQGAAAWLPPEAELNWPYSISNLLKTIRNAGFGALYRLARGGMVTEKMHPKTPHYYLFAIGVIPEHKGAGFGSALISRVLRQCDQEGMPAYLENSKEENLPFYEGHGFVVQQEVRFTRNAPRLWLMWREPLK